MKKTTKQKRFKSRDNIKIVLSGVLVAICTLGGFSAYHYVKADQDTGPVYIDLDPNLNLKQQVEEFFTANDAPEMIRIINCESSYRHFNQDGTVLKNKAGSSATGIAQILASVHPDPKIIEQYNKSNGTDLSISDFNISTLEGNLGYALILYEINGTRDWECAKNFRFNG